ncbi:MAG: TSUP family transporter, partial [Pseudomonadota bacterium]|nr:TSUP family transporter [Pseudomonadota bacterium]
SNFQVMPSSLPHPNWKRMLPVGCAAIVMAPFGAWILIAIEEDLMRRVVAGTSILLALILLAGWRYRGPRGLPVRVGVGGLGGLVTGSVSMGGPPVFLYLLSGSGNAASQRADFLAFGMMVQLGAIVAYALTGLITLDLILMAGILFVPFTLACWVGMRLFAHASDAQFRNYTLWGIAILSLVIAVV